MFLVQDGKRATHKGWPDFIVLDPKTGELAAVEVKHGPDEAVSKDQRFVLAALAAIGLPTYIWTPQEGLKKVKPMKGIKPMRTQGLCPYWDPCSHPIR